VDLNDVRSIVTVASFLVFIGIVWWAYSARRRGAFDEAARSVLEEPDDAVARGRGKGEHQ
jgi:cytochrome c oxidase cbb3-type subunit 4